MSENPPGAWWNSKQRSVSNLVLKRKTTQDYIYDFDAFLLWVHSPLCAPWVAESWSFSSLKCQGTTQSCQRSWELEENPYNQWNHGDGGPHHSLTNKLCSYRVDQSTGNQAERAAMKNHANRVEIAAAANLWGGNVGSLNPGKLPSRTPPNHEFSERKEIGEKKFGEKAVNTKGLDLPRCLI